MLTVGAYDFIIILNSRYFNSRFYCGGTIGGINNVEHWFIVNTFIHCIIFYGLLNSEIV